MSWKTIDMDAYQKAKKEALAAHSRTMLLGELCWFGLGIDPCGLSDETRLAIIREKKAYKEKNDGQQKNR